MSDGGRLGAGDEWRPTERCRWPATQTAMAMATGDGADRSSFGCSMHCLLVLCHRIFRLHALPEDALIRALPKYAQQGYFAKFQLAALFYIFYSMPKDEAQLYAAIELYITLWTSWVVSSVGSFTGGALADKFGRTRTFQLDAIPLAIGAFLCATSRSVQTMIIGRVLCGIGRGISSAIVPLYISEISPTEIRGALGSVNQLFICIGIPWGN